MKAFKTPIHGTGTFLLPLSIYAVVLMDFWPDVADKGQEVIQDFIPVLPEVGLKDGHLLLGVLLYYRISRLSHFIFPFPTEFTSTTAY